MVKDKDKVKGALYGVAVGDALGAPAEMMDRDELVEKFGKLDTMLPGGWFDRDAGEPTDDTAMMLCVGEGIMADPENPVPEVGKRFIEWVESGPPNIGMTSSHAIATARYLMHTIYKGQPEEAWDEAGLQATLEQGVPPAKLLFGIPLYMRLWEADAAGGPWRASTLSMAQADRLSVEKSLLPGWKREWLPAEKMFRCSYEENGKRYVFWQEDALSLYCKTRLVGQYGLAGTAAWRYGFETPDVWILLEEEKKPDQEAGSR